MSFSISRRAGAFERYEKHDLNGFLAMFHELDPDERDWDVTIRHHELQLSITAYATGVIVLRWEDGSGHARVFENALRTDAIRLCYALSQGNVAALVGPPWKSMISDEC